MLFYFGFELSVLLLGLFDLIDHVTDKLPVAAVHVPTSVVHHALAGVGEAFSIQDFVKAGDNTLCFHGHFIDIALTVLITGAKFVDPSALGQAVESDEAP